MDPNQRKELLIKAMAEGMSYAEYTALNKQLAKEGKTTGSQNEAYVNYTKLGAARLKRWEKMYTPTEEFLQPLATRMHRGEQWLVFSETWCGDAAHNLPFIAKWAEALGIELRVILRDENLDLMDGFLTGDRRSIPKLVRLSSDFQILSTW
ncbi:MAG TPA: thioredoxin family protein, partial [Cryomorphaceae bacterium]|nr:thioredoxin family protein [Cryomorphaceae bacterium]